MVLDDSDAAESMPECGSLFFGPPIETPDEYLRQLSGVTSVWHKALGTTRPWFRGMPREGFSLEPSLLRYRPRSLVATESNLVNQFRQYATGILPRLPESTIDLMALMQHHGVPTRLLDWTENALAALYFAVREHQYLKSEGDAVVWMLEPVMLTSERMGAPRIVFAHDDLMSKARLPLPFYPPHVAPRVFSQRAAFTLHPFRPQHSLIKLALREVKLGRLSPLRALRIRGTCRDYLRGAMIHAMGAGEITFFPDLDGLGRELRMREGLEGQG